MIETDLLESETAPCVELWLVLVVLPVGCIGDVLSVYEVQMELAEAVSESVFDFFLALSEGMVTSNEITGQECFKCFGKVSSCLDSQLFGQVFACVACVPFGELPYHRLEFFRFGEQGTEKPVEFHAEFGILGKKECIDVLR